MELLADRIVEKRCSPYDICEEEAFCLAEGD